MRTIWSSRTLLWARDQIAGLERLGGFKKDRSPCPSYLALLHPGLRQVAYQGRTRTDAQRVPSYSDWELRTQKAVFDSRRTRQELGWTSQSPIPTGSGQRRHRRIARSLAEGPGRQGAERVGWKRIHKKKKGRPRTRQSGMTVGVEQTYATHDECAKLFKGLLDAGVEPTIHREPRDSRKRARNGRSTGPSEFCLFGRSGLRRLRRLHEAVAKDKSEAIVATFLTWNCFARSSRRAAGRWRSSQTATTAEGQRPGSNG